MPLLYIYLGIGAIQGSGVMRNVHRRQSSLVVLVVLVLMLLMLLGGRGRVVPHQISSPVIGRCGRLVVLVLVLMLLVLLLSPVCHSPSSSGVLEALAADGDGLVSIRVHAVHAPADPGHRRMRRHPLLL